MPEDKESQIIHAIDKLATYARLQGLTVVYRALDAASSLLKELVGSSDHADIPESGWFGDVLSLLIFHARRKRWEEVLDHLLEAKMAWEERDEASSPDNILIFKKRSED